jgi:hypothetical protein
LPDLSQPYRLTLGQEQGLNRKPRRAGQNPDHNLALGNKQALTPNQIALTHMPIGGNARIIGIGNGDQFGQGRLRTCLKALPSL